MNNNLYLELEAYGGSHIEPTCADAVALATRLGVQVHFQFNGVCVMANPGCDPKLLAKRAQEEMSSGSAFKCACVHPTEIAAQHHSAVDEDLPRMRHDLLVAISDIGGAYDDLTDAAEEDAEAAANALRNTATQLNNARLRLESLRDEIEQLAADIDTEADK